MATLVHDDVLDRAELRRGRPTVAHAVRRRDRRLGRQLPAGARLPGAGRRRRRGGRRPAQRDRRRASARARSCSATRPTTSRVDVDGVRAPLRAQDGRPVRRRLPRSAPCSRAPGTRRPAPSASTAASSASPSRSSTTSSTAAATRRRTGKRPGTDVRDGTVTLPLIFALEARPGAGAASSARPGADDAEVGVVLERRRRERRPRACPRRRFGVH